VLVYIVSEYKKEEKKKVRTDEFGNVIEEKSEVKEEVD
jgi:hypothetical protein